MDEIAWFFVYRMDGEGGNCTSLDSRGRRLLTVRKKVTVLVLKLNSFVFFKTLEIKWLRTYHRLVITYIAFEVEKVRTVNYILASLHHDGMRGAMLFCPWVTFCSLKQSLGLYELPIDKQHKYEQNLKWIMRQSLVDVGLSIDRPSDLF